MMTRRHIALQAASIAAILGAGAPRIERPKKYYDPGEAPEPRRPILMPARSTRVKKLTRQLRRAAERDGYRWVELTDGTFEKREADL